MVVPPPQQWELVSHVSSLLAHLQPGGAWRVGNAVPSQRCGQCISSLAKARHRSTSLQPARPRTGTGPGRCPCTAGLWRSTGCCPCSQRCRWRCTAGAGAAAAAAVSARQPGASIGAVGRSSAQACGRLQRNPPSCRRPGSRLHWPSGTPCPCRSSHWRPGSPPCFRRCTAGVGMGRTGAVGSARLRACWQRKHERRARNMRQQQLASMQVPEVSAALFRWHTSSSQQSALAAQPNLKRGMHCSRQAGSGAEAQLGRRWRRAGCLCAAAGRLRAAGCPHGAGGPAPHQVAGANGCAQGLLHALVARTAVGGHAAPILCFRDALRQGGGSGNCVSI